jgi:hypothetical protein
MMTELRPDDFGDFSEPDGVAVVQDDSGEDEPIEPDEEQQQPYPIYQDLTTQEEVQ